MANKTPNPIAGSGEKIDKAKPQDYRYWFGVLVLTPIFIGVFAFLPFGKKILDRGSTVAVWTYMVVAGLVGLVALHFWARWVPARISLFLGIGVWAMCFWVVWHRQ
ncbi:MAG: hypothetical protein JNG83_05050 [Opitutaceae bacterium]|nr:hypothetical protein [Opitutaceae bacterium]